MFTLKLIFLLSTSVSVIRADTKIKSCCGEQYRNFTGTKCIAADFSQYLPDLRCDNFVLLAERIGDDEYDGYDGTACNVNYTIEPGREETLTVVCEEEPVQSFIMYLFPVSTLFLLATIGVYLKTRSYKLGQDVAVIVVCVCLAAVLIIRIMFLLNLDSDTFYALDEYVGKFALIAYFAWLNILMAHCLVKLIYDTDVEISPIVTHFYGWIVPTFVIYLNCIQAFGDHSADWLAREWYYKYLPITVLWCINLALFVVLTFHIIARNLRTSSANRQQSISWQFFRLILLASIWFTWLFEILSAKYPEIAPNFWHAMDVLNASHGVIVFVVMVICRKSICSKIMGRSRNWSTFSNSRDDLSQRYFIHNLNNVILTVSHDVDLHGGNSKKL
ncbi:uncharacterized protein LOC134834256 [Culicoides brevitarsis]|uniref:uncharacterized protein LOC134834256 n=1 Tax=Culicoides brevitarsis TaxID=469753 RepID=UPI00307B22B0